MSLTRQEAVTRDGRPLPPSPAPAVFALHSKHHALLAHVADLRQPRLCGEPVGAETCGDQSLTSGGVPCMGGGGSQLPPGIGFSSYCQCPKACVTTSIECGTSNQSTGVHAPRSQRFQSLAVPGMRCHVTCGHRAAAAIYHSEAGNTMSTSRGPQCHPPHRGTHAVLSTHVCNHLQISVSDDRTKSDRT